MCGQSGFTHALPLDPSPLKPRQDIQDVGSADKCSAYWHGDKTITYTACILF